MKRLSTKIFHREKNTHKNNYGHILILAGSPRMLGAAALTALSTMRSGAGLVTVGIPRSLNLALQKKISPVVMTLPLSESRAGSLGSAAFDDVMNFPADLIALGPGLSTHPETQKLILRVIRNSNKPLVIDADALNILSTDVDVLTQTDVIKILTPHPGEMGRLIKRASDYVQNHRVQVASDFAKRFDVTVILKGHHSVIASSSGKSCINKTGNPGMATAGSGDVLTGIVAGFLAQGLRQGLSAFEIAKLACSVHGRAGDLAAKKKTMPAMIAPDIIDEIPAASKGIL